MSLEPEFRRDGVIVRGMSLYRDLGELIQETQELRDKLLGDEPSKEREIEVTLAAHIQFVQQAFLHVARELDALRATVEGRDPHSRG
jgi:hypothetical protein